MKKYLIVMVAMIIMVGCNSPTVSQESGKMVLPEKENPESVLMSESSITSSNIDDYLFLEDCLYIDTRDPNQFLEEGFIAGFRNIPFYDCLVSVKEDKEALFWMRKTTNENTNETILLGEIGSFEANYEESEQIIKDLFPKNKKILIISTAGVESTYLMNLLLQLGYDGANLYNVGCFSNSLAGHIAYRNREDARYFVEGTNVYTVNQSYDWGTLTPLSKE